jgi:hypothetical protein
MKAKADPTHIKDLIPDPANLRKHGERNIALIEKSLETVGAARSIVIDEENRILAGNGVVEGAGNIGLERVRVVEADGHEIIAVRRRGLTEEQKVALAIADNRTGELSEWDVAALLAIPREQTSTWFSEKEIEILAGTVTAPADFKEVDENIEIEHVCPKCGYAFSGGQTAEKSKK